MKSKARIFVFALVLALVFVAVIVPGVAADDVIDFIGKEERQARERQADNTERPICNERPQPRTATDGVLRSYGGRVDNSHVNGGRLETRFEVAPALQGSGANPYFQAATHSTLSASEHPSIAPGTVEPEPISEWIPPPNTGRGNYLRWAALGGLILLVGLLPVMRTKARRHRV